MNGLHCKATLITPVIGGKRIGFSVSTTYRSVKPKLCMYAGDHVGIDASLVRLRPIT